MIELDFIKDLDLKRTLENSLDFVYSFRERFEDFPENKFHQEENHRIVILYVVSAIEALLLYFYKDRGEKTVNTDYKFIHTLPNEFIHCKKSFSPVVIAVQEKTEKLDRNITLRDLVSFFKDKKLIQEVTANKILELNDVRNTFHFSKPRAKNCDLARVESALNLLVYTLERAPKALMKN